MNDVRFFLPGFIVMVVVPIRDPDWLMASISTVALVELVLRRANPVCHCGGPSAMCKKKKLVSGAVGRTMARPPRTVSAYDANPVIGAEPVTRTHPVRNSSERPNSDCAVSLTAAWAARTRLATM